MTCYVLIIGRGRMGTRYELVCKYLGIPCQTWDIIDGTEMPRHRHISHCLITTNTESHWPVFSSLDTTHWSIMVEKPVSMVPEEADLFALCKGFCVNNWCHVFEDSILKPEQHTIEYSSLHFGPHTGSGFLGEKFDLCQLYYLAKESPKVERSAIWKAIIDGRAVSLFDIDMSYIRMVKSWISGEDNKLWTLAQGSEMTHKVLSS